MDDPIIEKKNYQSWTKKISSEIKISNDLQLIGSFFNAYQNIYLLCVSSAKKQLYITTYHVLKNELGEFRTLVQTPETIYSASVYEENEQYTRWYLLGHTTVWHLTLNKPTFAVSSLTPFSKDRYPHGYYDKYRIHEGSSLIVFDRLPWVIGGKSCENGNGATVDTSKRVLLGARWGVAYNQYEGDHWVGESRNDYLVFGRVAPILHIYDQHIICIGGNKKAPANIFEVIPIRPYYHIARHGYAREDSTTYIYMTERSIISYSRLNCDINTEFPRPASCIFDDCIFIFSDHLFRRDTVSATYYKYHFSGGRASGGGSGDWEFLTPPDISKKELSFSSAKAVVVGSVIYLILFNAAYEGIEGKDYGTLIRIFEIKTPR